MGADWIVVIEQHPCLQSAHGSRSDADRIRRIENSAAGGGHGSCAAVSLPALFGGLIASGFLPLSKGASPVCVDELEVAFAGDNPDRAIGIPNLKFRPRRSRDRLYLEAADLRSHAF
jgi:hypothetical protein